MDDLQINWHQEKPTASQLTDLWKSIRFLPINNWTPSTNLLKEKIDETHSNGGIQLHKYKVVGNETLDWFACRNRLDEIEFLKNISGHKDLNNYKADIEVTERKLNFKIIKYLTDIYDLPGQLSRILAIGGAYNNIEQRIAWTLATNFVRDEFQNRFQEFNSFDISYENANWFYDIAWDYSTILFDKRNYELTFIDITDSD